MPCVFAVSHPVRGDISRVANGKHVNIGSISQRINYFESSGLLTLKAVRIHRIDQSHREPLSQFTNNSQTIVKVAIYSHEICTMHNGLR